MTRRDEYDLLCDLIRIDSTNPGLVTGGAGESTIADHVSAWLGARGFAVHRLESTPGRPSVVAIHHGTGGGASIMLNGHLDAVSLASYAGDGLAPVENDGKLFGRGAYDMKSGIAAMMTAAATVAGSPHAGDIMLALVADEEHASAGTEEVLRSFTADAAIVVEPTGTDVVIAHRGFAWFEATVHGRAAHGSRRDLGIDAITAAGPFLTALREHDRDLAGRPPHPLLGTGNIHASTISGGEELSSYPASCTISLERRTLPGETSDTVERELRHLLDGLTRTDPQFQYTLRPGLERSPFHIDATEPVVAALAGALEQRTGWPPIYRGEPFWTDCALLSDAGIPTVLFGVDGGGAHAATEWVTLDSLHVVTDTLTEAIRRLTD